LTARSEWQLTELTERYPAAVLRRPSCCLSCRGLAINSFGDINPYRCMYDITLEWSEITGDHNTPDTTVKAGRNK